ncbi:MAG TPA: transporter, partial [Anaeromyxobacteraceae bacterium]|nr:transporter [Anaeromyxobacteraceae bacterium]
SAAIALAVPAPGAAQVPELGPPAPPPAGRRFTIGIGAGATATLNMLPDWTATATVALAYAIDERWSVSLAPYFERETDFVDGARLSYDEISLAVGASLALDQRWSLAMELDFGLVENAPGAWERNPEFGVGVGVSYAIPLAPDWNLVLGPELAWKISDGEISLGVNTGVTFDL